MFADRNDAGMLLAQKIKKEKKQYDLVIALPRGGVPVAKTIAQALDLPLFLMYVKKLAQPDHEEFAIGAISALGIQFNEKVQIEAEMLPEVIKRSRDRIKEMKRKFNHEIDIKKIKNKDILLIDDGIATGQCIILAAHEIRKGGPTSITIATPVCPQTIIPTLTKQADEVISILTPQTFWGIGQFYEDFHQMTDSEVIRILHEKGCLKRQPVNSVSNG